MIANPSKIFVFTILLALISPVTAYGANLRDRFPVTPTQDNFNKLASPSICKRETRLALQEVTLSTGRTATIWYPTSSEVTNYVYEDGFKTKVALNAPLRKCNRPLVVFSHGYGGCSTQVAYLTESLALAGYIVIAPNHLDATCGSFASRPTSQQDFGDPATWSDATYADRHDDINAAVEFFGQGTNVNVVNLSNVAIAGHSLGGYSAIGVSGGWASWKNPKFKASLLFSPYTDPYLLQGRLALLQSPVMYQGGTLDFGITPTLGKTGGAYDSSPRPRYFMKLKKASHLAWTDIVCGSKNTTSKCLASSINANLVVRYSLAFLNTHILKKSASLLTKKNSQFAVYKFQVK